MHVFRGTHIKSTFISKIGILYLEDKILIETQARKSAHGTENQWRVLINNVELPENQNVARDTGLFVSRFARSVHIKVAGDMDINATVVAATFGKRGSGANYINFKILQLKVSPSIHGILGQTYQETVRAYQKLHAAKGKKRSRAAAVLVDGLDKDYVTSDILAPNCKFGVFEEQTRGFSRLVRRVVLERAQSLFTKSSKDEIVCDCTGFGDHNLCLTSQG
ncbi:hypothetical protein O6H91_06G024000 [Diphasiastrum complanatum]|uniref:Uncharacterized protein n=1 Tax=Diphasiastrum complanatum TaxID=34168 RepID=A0ACC2DBP1_DIPCM|nr:hypothetical protein O6H91_06G024000 [Diphasiastrum complanatum]